MEKEQAYWSKLLFPFYLEHLVLKMA